MSSTAAPNRTEPTLEQQTVEAVRTMLGAAVFVVLLVSFTPFNVQSAATADSGNVINQIGYGSLGLLALFGHLMFTDRRVALSLLRPTWLLMAAWLVFSITQSNWPDAAFRAVLFSLFAMVAATGVVCLPTTARGFRVVLIAGALAVLGLSYAGLVVLPDIAIHTASGDEPEHAGLWRGIYSHKNVAGPVMAALFFVGLYLLRSGERWFGWVITLLAALFVYKTGSKTSAA
ncbi:MAG: O-antigen ligase family protein, partial [Variovorax sp.]